MLIHPLFYDFRTNLMRAPPSNNNNLNHTNVYGYETDSLDNVRSKKKVPQQNQNNSKQNVAEPFGYSRHNASRFASALETPALDMTTTEKMRTPRLTLQLIRILLNVVMIVLAGDC